MKKSSLNLLICIIVLTFSTIPSFADYTDSVLKFGDSFNCPDGTVDENVTASGRQSGDWATSAIDNQAGNDFYIDSNVFMLATHDSQCYYTDFTLNDIKSSFHICSKAYRSYIGASYIGMAFGVYYNGTSSEVSWGFSDDTPFLWDNGGIHGNQNNYYNSELKRNWTNDWCYLSLLYSDRNDGHTWTACFVNDEPTTLNDSGEGTILDLTHGLTDNIYTRIGEWRGSDSIISFDNLEIRSVSPTYDMADWTDDASSMINSSKTYTHAINCGSDDILINGVQFTGNTNNAASYGSNWKIWNLANETSVDKGTATTTINGNGATLAQSYYTADTALTLQLSGLTTGSVYTLTLYCNASDAADVDVPVATSDKEGGIATINGHGSSAGKIINYTYMPSPNGKLAITFDTHSSAGWKLYAFSNAETIPECSLFFGFLTMAGLFIRRLKQNF